MKTNYPPDQGARMFPFALHLLFKCLVIDLKEKRRAQVRISVYTMI